MTYLVIKALISGIIVAAASEMARRWPGRGALMVALDWLTVRAGPKLGLRLQEWRVDD